MITKGHPVPKHYSDYTWKGGVPYGKAPLKKAPAKSVLSYLILSDPYYKRISIERYCHGEFHSVVYDSAVFDFRLLKPAEQVAWHKTTVRESADEALSLIRNQDGRIILQEAYRFQGNLCRECRASSPHGIPVSLQRMFYHSLKDLFNGVILYDINNHPVMFKKYLSDPVSGEFTELVEEQWNMQSNALPPTGSD